MPFESGVSGNPQGRKKGIPNRSTREMRELVRSVVNFEELILTLAEKGKQGDLQAVKILLEPETCVNNVI